MTQAPSPAAAQPLSLVQRVIGVVVSPGDTMARIAAAPRWIDVLALTTILVAAGYFLYRSAHPCGCLSFVVPTFEVHVTTPLNHRGALTEPIGLADIVNLTGGVTVGLGKQATLGMATVVPVTGPRPWDIEAQGYVNFRF